VFFAIPLATLVEAVIKAWPLKHRQEPAEVTDRSQAGSSG
jgi:hypothetical protein